MAVSTGERIDAVRVGRYLDFLASESDMKKSGGQGGDSVAINLESCRAALEKIPERIKKATTAVQRLQLMQRERELNRALKRLEQSPDLEADFIASAKAYADKAGIEYATWRDAGVSADVLRRAGISGPGVNTTPKKKRSDTGGTHQGPKNRPYGEGTISRRLIDLLRDRGGVLTSPDGGRVVPHAARLLAVKYQSFLGTIRRYGDIFLLDLNANTLSLAEDWESLVGIAGSQEEERELQDA